jgi:hypothetical protein
MTDVSPFQRWKIEHAAPEPGTLLATRDEWELRAKTWPCNSLANPSPWHNFVLIAPATSLRKRKFFSAWNGERVARSKDMGVLAKHYPDKMAWVLDACRTANWQSGCGSPTTTSAARCGCGSAALP